MMSSISDVEHTRLDATVYPDCVIENHYVSDAITGQVRHFAKCNISRSVVFQGLGHALGQRKFPNTPPYSSQLPFSLLGPYKILC